MRRIRSVVAVATGLAAAFLSVPAAWAATPDVPETLRISNSPYEGSQLCGAQTPPTFSTTNGFAPLFAASVKGVDPQPDLGGSMEFARPGEQPFRTFQVSTGPVGHGWGSRFPPAHSARVTTSGGSAPRAPTARPAGPPGARSP